MRIFLALTLVLALSACGTFEGIGKDLRSAGDTMTSVFGSN